MHGAMAASRVRKRCCRIKIDVEPVRGVHFLRGCQTTNPIIENGSNPSERLFGSTFNNTEKPLKIYQ